MTQHRAGKHVVHVMNQMCAKVDERCLYADYVIQFNALLLLSLFVSYLQVYRQHVKID